MHKLSRSQTRVQTHLRASLEQRVILSSYLLDSTKLSECISRPKALDVSHADRRPTPPAGDWSLTNGERRQCCFAQLVISMEPSTDGMTTSSRSRRRLGNRFEWVLHVGDFGVRLNPNRIDRATRTHDGAGDFPAWFANRRAAPRRRFSSRATTRTSSGSRRSTLPRCCAGSSISGMDER